MNRQKPHETEPGANGDVFQTAAGEAVWGPLDSKADVAHTHSMLVPLTTSINGVPELVWDADNQLVMTEVPL